LFEAYNICLAALWRQEASRTKPSSLGWVPLGEHRAEHLPLARTQARQGSYTIGVPGAGMLRVVWDGSYPSPCSAKSR